MVGTPALLLFASCCFGVLVGWFWFFKTVTHTGLALTMEAPAGHRVPVILLPWLELRSEPPSSTFCFSGRNRSLFPSADCMLWAEGSLGCLVLLCEEQQICTLSWCSPERRNDRLSGYFSFSSSHSSLTLTSSVILVVLPVLCSQAWLSRAC